MKAVDFSAKLAETPLSLLRKNKIHPAIRDEKAFEAIGRELAEYFENLLAIYRPCATNGRNVVVRIG